MWGKNPTFCGANFDITRATFRKGQNRNPHFSRTFAIESHSDISHGICVQKLAMKNQKRLGVPWFNLQQVVFFSMDMLFGGKRCDGWAGFQLDKQQCKEFGFFVENYYGLGLVAVVLPIDHCSRCWKCCNSFGGTSLCLRKLSMSKYFLPSRQRRCHELTSRGCGLFAFNT